LMSISRVILWVHWPFDIIVGIIIWIISAIISFKLLKWNKYINKFNNFILKISKIFKL
jgi:membrane-associated phospholipid phosphatase